MSVVVIDGSWLEVECGYSVPVAVLKAWLTEASRLLGPIFGTEEGVNEATSMSDVLLLVITASRDRIDDS